MSRTEKMKFIRLIEGSDLTISDALATTICLEAHTTAGNVTSKRWGPKVWKIISPIVPERGISCDPIRWIKSWNMLHFTRSCHAVRLAFTSRITMDLVFQNPQYTGGSKNEGLAARTSPKRTSSWQTCGARISITSQTGIKSRACCTRTYTT